jgi:hypothetical protein
VFVILAEVALLPMFQQVAVKPEMIIKGVLGRYERWNPVHPTAGAFWGMGLGLGCGVGWGPGFGPEVVGYVGAGCGVGFSVGFTLAGVGIGLPQPVFIKTHDHGGKRCSFNARNQLRSAVIGDSVILSLCRAACSCRSEILVYQIPSLFVLVIPDSLAGNVVGASELAA